MHTLTGLHPERRAHRAAAVIALLTLIAAIAAILAVGSAPASASATPSASPSASASPSGAPSPSPSPPPPGTPPRSPGPQPGQAGAGQPGCGFFDVTCRVSRAVTGWFGSLVSSALTDVFGMLGQSLLATPQLDQLPQVRNLWTGSLVVANSCFVLLVLLGGLILMGYETVHPGAVGVEDPSDAGVDGHGAPVGGG